MADPICLPGCDPEIPQFVFDDCAPEVNLSEINEIFIAKANAEPFEDWEDLSEWTTRLAPSTEPAAPADITRLVVTGDKPLPEDNVLAISNGRDYAAESTHTINFDIDETGNDNYDAMRQFRCVTQLRVWYGTRGGKIYGGNEGIKASIRFADVLQRGDEIERFTGTITWKNKFDPERIDNPML